METNVAEKGKAKVRISKSLSEGEKTAIASRKEVVKKGLEKLGIPCDLDKVPDIVVLGSGGGMRAMIALYGTLSELKKYNFLDCVTYLSAVSGSSWCLSDLYKEKNWTEKIEILEKHACEKLANGQWEFEKATKVLLEAVEDECYSLTDFWSYFLVHKLLNQLDETELSSHRESCDNGKNPYPIYAAVDKDTYLTQHEGTWFEFTPHEVGVPGLGAYVDMKYFGSFFENEELTKERKEKNICYLQGLWGSAFGSEEALLNVIKGALQDFLKHGRCEDALSADIDEDDQKLSKLFEGYQSVLELKLSESLEGAEAEKQFDHLETILQGFSKSCELLRKIRQTWPSPDAESRKEEYLSLSQAMDMDFGAGVEFPELTSKPIISLIDAGLTINTAYPSVVRPERQVKLIISFDYSGEDPFQTIKKASKFCEAYGIPFPEINERELEDIDDPSDCYIFRGEQVPTVMHCPLFNKVNCPGKIAEYREEFSTFKLRYSNEAIEKLLSAAKKNVANVQEKIVEEIKHIVGSSSQKA